MSDVVKYKMLIGGEWVDAVSGETIRTISPSTGEILGTIPSAGPEDIDCAVKAANRAFADWRNIDAQERGRLVREVGRRLRERIPDLATLGARDNGSPVRSLRRFAQSAADRIEYFGGLGIEIKGETIPTPGNTFNYTLREPFGVVAQLIPWNAPLVFPGSKIPPALVAGNTVVLKVSELAPLPELELAKIFNEVLPPGVVNVVTGYGNTAGAPLVSHPLVRKVSFTGSIATGRRVMQQAAENITPVMLEHGGKSPNIVFPDADLDKAVLGALNGMCLFLQGQACFACTRLFLHVDIYDKFLEALLRKLESVRIGMPTEEETEMGALISKAHLDRVMGYIKLGLDEGAHVIAGGNQPDDPSLSAGNFLCPTVLVDVRNEMRVAQEEIFGPVLCVLPWSDYDKMIHEANDVVYGLAAAIWTENISLAHKTAKRLEAGYIWINHFAGTFTGVPFGGYKQSGFGREHSLTELLDYTQEKNVNVGF